MQQLTYEQAITELQSIVNDLQLEGGNIDQLGDRASRAIELIQYCKQKLRHTETQIDHLFPEPEKTAQ